jgi:hydroxymethylbilane synthase
MNTRLARLDNGDYDAIVLACAGLKRLGMAARITRALTPEELLPAIGQGVIGIECRLDDAPIRQLIETLNHAQTWLCLQAERAFNAVLSGGCQTPVAGFSLLNDDLIELRGLVGRPDGGEIVRGQISGPAQDAESLGRELAEDLLARGARRILDELLGGN